MKLYNQLPLELAVRLTPEQRALYSERNCEECGKKYYVKAVWAERRTQHGIESRYCSSKCQSAVSGRRWPLAQHAIAKRRAKNK